MTPLNLSLAVVLAAAAPGALAQGAPHPDLGRNIAATCANCHGTGGKTVANSPVAALAGRPKDDLVRAMNDFRDGKRPASIMHQLAKGFTPEQIEAVSAWFAAQK